MKTDENKPYSKKFWSDFYSCEFNQVETKKSEKEEEKYGHKYNICNSDCAISRKFSFCIHEEINRLAEDFPEKQSLTIPFNLIEGVASEKILEHIIKKTSSALADAQCALHEVDYLPSGIDYTEWEKTGIKISGMKPMRIRDIRHENKNTLIAVSGIILRKTEVKFHIIEAVFDCQRCDHATHILEVGTGIFVRPFECENDTCGRKGPFILNEEESTWGNKRKIRIQETTDNITDGDQTLGGLDAVLIDDVECPPLGSIVTITGILNIVQKVTAQGETGEFTPILFINNIEAQDREKTIECTPEELIKMKEMAKDPNIIERLVSSTVPSVRGNEIIKEACLCSIVSPNSLMLPDGRQLRGQSHVMLCGDPGVAKSVLLLAMVGYVPRAQYAAGRAASTKGLTVSVTKETGGWGEGAWVAEAGMLVLADRAFAVIDELDKFEKPEQRDLNTVLEHGIVPVRKAGINRDFYARVPIVASLNPKNGRFDRYEPIPKQVNVPPDTLSRFDLVFTIFDVPNVDDRQTAEHITELWQKATEVHQTEFKNIQEITAAWKKDKYIPEISLDMMRKWIYEAKKIQVRITSECRTSLNDFFMDVRFSQSKDADAAIPIAWRTLDGMMRLVICETRLRHGNVTEMRDVDRVKALVQESFKVMIDPETGKLDSDIISVGMGKSQRDRIKILRDIIKELQDELKSAAPLNEITERAIQAGMKEGDIQYILKKMKTDGDLLEASNERYRIT
ncbi:MAG: minichromosome maintenance protein MCM [Euryarchaeota archaeon]|nr:minichromosome maintenance protein MCM [Euryarchaeota archaeon]MCG2727863.1 minichromosome maintenance protein MCM [Candidatus Methanoperedenaceae archaeon]